MTYSPDYCVGVRDGTPRYCTHMSLPLLEETSGSSGSRNGGQMSSHPSHRSVMCEQAKTPLKVEANTSVSLAFLLSVSFGHSLI